MSSLSEKANTSEVKMSFEEALEELEGIVSELEENQLTLEEAVKVFSRGIALSAYCAQKLDEAEGKITILMQEANSYKERPFPLKEEVKEDV